MSLIAELQRRSVFKVAAAYLVVGWLVTQAASIAFPTFQAPEWALRVFIFVVLLGFPIALVIAWAVELTPEGLKLDAAPTGNKRFFAVTGLIAALAVGWWYLGHPSAQGDGDARSIAVLPFVNMSGEADNEFFSDGISEEILNALAQMEGLKVAARTSSFSFKGTNKEVRDIARELDVRMVLEGSVRKQGPRVRITSQLIDASNGYHVWSQTYDRDLKDIFVIQDEIARAIARQLEVKLGVAQQGDATHSDTTDLEAYEMYLKGMQLWQARGYENMVESRRLFREVVKRDPKFAKGWAGLALAETLAPDWLGEPNREALPRSRDAAERALALDPLVPEAYAALGNTAAGEGRMETAFELFARAVAIAPSYATAWHWWGFHLGTSGWPEEGERIGRRAIELDPKSTIVRWDYSVTVGNIGPTRYAEVARMVDELLAERPDWSQGYVVRYGLAMGRKDYPAARAALRVLAEPRGPASVALMDRMIDALEGKGDRAKVAAELLPLPDGFADPKGLSPLDDSGSMYWFFAANMPEKAVWRLQRLGAERPQTARQTLVNPDWDPYRCRADFQAVIAQIGYDDPRSARLCGAKAEAKGNSVGTSP